MKDIYWKGHTILLLISLLCCFPDFVYAYSLRQFSNKNGLSNSAIQSLYQDSQGVLWIGTCDGLNVFDGNNIHLYTPVDVSRNLLSGNIISQIVESEPGILWLLTNVEPELTISKIASARPIPGETSTEPVITCLLQMNGIKGTLGGTQAATNAHIGIHLGGAA